MTGETVCRWSHLVPSIFVSWCQENSQFFRAGGHFAGYFVLGESNITEGNCRGSQRKLPFGEQAPLITVLHNVATIFVT
jgi:hypothetical protein